MSPAGFSALSLPTGSVRIMGMTAWVVLAAVGLIGLAFVSQQPLWVVITFPFVALYRVIAAADAPPG